MTSTIILSPEEKKELTEAMEKVSIALTEIIKRKDSGEVTVFFHEGKFKRARKNTTV